jgi:DNA-binding transcriptional ArsR family regulator
MREGSEPLPFSWEELVPLLIHPLRVAIIEALRRVGKPLSTADLNEVFDDDYALSVIAYHLGTLVEVDAIEVISRPEAAGSAKRLYRLAAE